MELGIVTLEITASLDSLSLFWPGTGKNREEKSRRNKAETQPLFSHLHDLSQSLSE